MLSYAGMPMPAAVPGASSPLPNRVMPVPSPLQPPSSPLSAIRPSAGPSPLPPALASAIQAPQTPATPQDMIPAPPSENPGDHDWMVETQSDGTLLLRIKNADGTGGPIVKIVSGVKVPGAA